MTEQLGKTPDVAADLDPVTGGQCGGGQGAEQQGAQVVLGENDAHGIGRGRPGSA